MKRVRRYGKRQQKRHESQERIIDEFCMEHGITRSASGKSYYFRIRGRRYRVSDHFRWQSDCGMYDQVGNKIRESYKKEGIEEREIRCGKTKIIQVYNALKAGKTVNEHGIIMD